MMSVTTKKTSQEAVLEFLRTYRDPVSWQCTIPLHGIAFELGLSTDQVRRILDRLVASGSVEMKWQYSADYDGTPAYAATHEEARKNDWFNSKLRGTPRWFRVLGLVFALSVSAQTSATAAVDSLSTSYATWRKRRLCWGSC